MLLLVARVRQVTRWRGEGLEAGIDDVHLMPRAERRGGDGPGPQGNDGVREGVPVRGDEQHRHRARSSSQSDGRCKRR
jgi:hypothetical protein